MQLDPSDLRLIASRAAFFSERAALHGSGPDAAEVVAAIQQRIKSWKDACAAGDEPTFERRLAYDSLTTEEVSPLLHESWQLPEGHTPGWLGEVPALLEAYTACADQDFDQLTTSFSFLQPGSPIAFEHLLGPVVTYFAAKLEAETPLYARWLEPSAQNQLQHRLLSSLAMIGAETLGVEFNIFRAVKRGMSSPTAPASPDSTEVYREFVDRQRRGALASTLKRYPLVLRYWITAGSFLVENTKRFLSHLEQDEEAISSSLNDGKPLGKIRSLEAGISDAHEGGKTSIRVRFSEGLETIYKPKDLSTEIAYHELLKWLNDHNPRHALRGYQVLSRDDHGWVEVVFPGPCQSAAEVAAYYHRAGILLALFYAIEGSDVHNENLIAAGPHPMIVDLETIFQPRPRQESSENDGDALTQANLLFYWDSVFRTAMLPRWEMGANGESFDISGLGGVEGQRTSFRQKGWRHINTDAMSLARQFVSTAPDQNVVRLAGKTQFPSEHREEILAGFTECYRILADNRDHLLQAGSPLAKIAALPVRFILRNTRIYVTLLRKLLLPRNLTLGPDASIVTETLLRPFLYTPERHRYWQILQKEGGDLLQLDIPRFTVQPEGNELIYGEGQTFPGFFAEPAWAQIKRRFATLGDEDLALQKTFIRTSLVDMKPDIERSDGQTHSPSPASPDPDSWEQEALRLAENTVRDAIRTQSGAVTWLTLSYFAEAQRWQIQPMAARLYDGLCGTLLFLAAVERCAGDTIPLGDTIAGATRSITTFVQDGQSARFLFEAGTGAGLGASSLVYGLAVCGSLLEDSSYLDLAEKAGSWITLERCESDDRQDLLGGNAGAVLSLLKLHSLRSEGRWLEQAVAVGRQLLASRVETASGHRAWLTLEGKPLLGISHGAAGIAMALDRLATASGETEFRDAAIEALDYENTLFDADLGNWPDLRWAKSKQGYHFETRWCHGAPGIALARAFTKGIPQAGNDLAPALETTQRAPFSPLDHLCCGNLGRAQILQFAARSTRNPDWETAAQNLTQQVLDTASQKGRYQLGLAPGLPIYAFHQGLGGIGYHYLWMNPKHGLPCILAWE